MSSKGNATASSSSSSSSSSPVAGKRSRDPEDEVYLDNLRSQKRYLSEIMASSLNGLTVGDSLSENLIDSPVRSESMLYLRDEISLSDYSPMSEDSDDSRYNYEISSTNTCSSQPESEQTSPVSPPYRCPKLPSGFGSSGSLTSYLLSSQQPRQRGSDTEGRFPSSPSEICHSADLRKAALLRSVQMRARPLGLSLFEMPYNSGQESGGNNMEANQVQTCSCLQPVVEERTLYQIAECSPLSISEPEKLKSCSTVIMNL